jgi:heat shock protein HslJ
MKNAIFFFVTATFFAAACSNNSSSSDKKIQSEAPTPITSAEADSTKLNGNWQLHFIEGMARPFDSVYAGKVPYIVFDIAADRFSGNTGCNNFSGELELTGNAISFLKPMIMTKMFCQGDGEPFFVQNLQKVTSWAISKDSILHFKSTGGDVMRFTKKGDLKNPSM